MDIFSEAIAQTEKFSGGGDEQTKTLPIRHVAFGVDANFIRPMGVTITSILENNLSEVFHFHVFANSIDAVDVERLATLARQYRTTIFLYHINQAIFKQLPTTWQYSHATYNRFLLATVLHGIADKALYLDADMVCIGKLQPLFEMDFAGQIAIAAHDVKNGFVQQQMEKLKLRHGKYFNAGMLYIDIRRWHEEDISVKAVALLLENYGFFNLLDQDALNVLLDGKVRFVDNCWNFMCNLEKKVKCIPPGTVIIHYTSRAKPWHRWCIHPMALDFKRYAAKSLWKDVPPDSKPRNYKEMRMLGRALLQEYNWIEAVHWYWRYWQAKRQAKKGISQ